MAKGKTAVIAPVDMHNDTMEALIKEYKEYKNMKAQIEAKLKEIESKVKTDMLEHGVDCAAYGEYKCMITDVTTATFDKSIVLAENPDLYERCSIEKTTKRFTIK